MNDNFINKSKNLLLHFLKEPGGFSFFPSPFFWWKLIPQSDLKDSFLNYFKSNNYVLGDNNKLNLYIHIPYCSRICSYCNCFKRQLKDDIDIVEYIWYLEKEVKLIYNLNWNKKLDISTIFIWGGTPNILSVEHFVNINGIINTYFNLKWLEQFILDWHPNYYSNEKLDYLKSIKVNRITYAIQTFDENVLELNNRDVYDLDNIRESISYAKKVWFDINIDLLIWLKWQKFTWILKDIEIVNSLWIDNVSVHYLMDSNNMNYKLDENYHELVIKTKKYLSKNKLPNWVSNRTEDYYASKINSTLSIWATGVTNIFWEIAFIKPNIEKYYTMLNGGDMPFEKWLILSLKDEMIRYIYLNILYWINVNEFNRLFWSDMFSNFIWEFQFLNKNNIIRIENWYIKSNKSDFETLIYFNVFFLEKYSNFFKFSYNNPNFRYLFSEWWEMIDK